MDPNHDIILQTAETELTKRVISVLAGLFESRVKWLWAHWGPGAQRRVQDNCINFGRSLDAAIQRAVNEGKIDVQRVQASLDRPDVMDALVKALDSAASTDNIDQHLVLAQIIATRLYAPDNALLGTASRLACDAVGYLSSNQIKLLGLLYALTRERFSPSDPTMPPEERTSRAFEWIVTTLGQFRDVEIGVLDAEHLEATGCLGGPKGFLVGDFGSTIRTMVGSDTDVSQFERTETGTHLNELFQHTRIAGLVLTSTGELIGMNVFSLLTGNLRDPAVLFGTQ